MGTCGIAARIFTVHLTSLTLQGFSCAAILITILRPKIQKAEWERTSEDLLAKLQNPYTSRNGLVMTSNVISHKRKKKKETCSPLQANCNEKDGGHYENSGQFSSLTLELCKTTQWLNFGSRKTEIVTHMPILKVATPSADHLRRYSFILGALHGEFSRWNSWVKCRLFLFLSLHLLLKYSFSIQCTTA